MKLRKLRKRSLNKSYNIKFVYREIEKCMDEFRQEINKGLEKFKKEKRQVYD